MNIIIGSQERKVERPARKSRGDGMRLNPGPRVGLALFIVWIMGSASVLAEEPLPPAGLLTLQEAVEIALSHHPSLLSSRGTLQVNEARVGEARSNYLPQVNALGTFTRATANFAPSTQSSQSLSQPSQSVNQQLAPPPSNDTNDNYTATVGLRQLIFDFGKTTAQMESARENLRGSSWDDESSRQNVVVNVKVAYFGLLQAQRLVQVQEETVQQFEQHLEQAEGFYRAGTRTRYDVTTAKVNLTNAQLELIKARNAQEVARVTLANAMGVPDRPIDKLEDLLSFKKVEITEDQAIQEALANRPELLSLSAQRRSAEASIRSAKRDYFPVLNGFADYTWRGQDYPLVWNWDVGLSLSFPLYSGSLTSYQVAEARSNLIVAGANEEASRQNILLEVHQAFSNLRDAEERVQTSNVVVGQAEENLDLANGRFQAGLGTTVEQTDAQVLLTNAKTAQLQALYDYRVAAAQMQKAVGRKE
jgi:outer membrane protein